MMLVLSHVHSLRTPLAPLLITKIASISFALPHLSAPALPCEDAPEKCPLFPFSFPTNSSPGINIWLSAWKSHELQWHNRYPCTIVLLQLIFDVSERYSLCFCIECVCRITKPPVHKDSYSSGGAPPRVDYLCPYLCECALSSAHSVFNINVSVVSRVSNPFSACIKAENGFGVLSSPQIVRINIFSTQQEIFTQHHHQLTNKNRFLKCF